MVFNSFVFIFAFLPIVLLGYYSLNYLGKYQLAEGFLTIMSLIFCGYLHISYAVLLAGSIVVNYLFYRILKRKPGKMQLVTAILVNLIVLGYFKYFNFFLENINFAVGSSFHLRNIILPLGISFFTFQQISFLVDTFKGETEEIDILEYALFVSFFPQLVAGPIVSHQEMIPQFRMREKKKPDSEYIIKGIQMFTLGMGKKILLADVFGEAVNWGFSNYESISSTNAIMVSVFYTFQLYFDFSGYCDMAKGIGYLLNISLPSNFQSPYKAEGIISFWKRWHMTLGRFFTKYVYIPLGGSRRGKLRTCLNSFFVFFLSGLWHGANWTFVFWGILHGIGYIADYLTKNLFAKVPKWIKRTVTFVYVNFAFVAFRAESLTVMKGMYGAIFRGDFTEPSVFMCKDELWLPIKFFHLDRFPGAPYFPMIIYVMIAAYFCFAGPNSEEIVERSKRKLSSAVVMAAVFFYSILSLSGVSYFLYFNF